MQFWYVMLLIDLNVRLIIGIYNIKKIQEIEIMKLKNENDSFKIK